MSLVPLPKLSRALSMQSAMDVYCSSAKEFQNRCGESGI